MIELDQKTIETLKEKGKKSMFFLARAVLGFHELDVDIHLPICKKLEMRERYPKLVIQLPRDWFKSTLGSIVYPIWRAINNPDVRIVIVQNTFSNACRKLQAIKQIFEKNKLFRALYPEILPTDCGPWTRECLTVNRNAAHPEGTFEGAGVGTALTSRHYDDIIEDDTVAPEKDSLKGIIQQPTQLEIEKSIGWHRIAYPLQVHPTKSRRIVIGTRWAVADLIGWILNNEPENDGGYNLVSRSAIEDGKPVWDRFGEEALSSLEKVLGPYMFKTLFLNLPTEAINQVFRRSWISYYSNIPKTKTKYGVASLITCTSVDPAASDTEGSSDPDYNIILTTTLNVTTGHVYVNEYSRARMNPGELIAGIFEHHRKYKPLVVKIESIAYQRTIKYWIMKRQRQLNERFYVEEIKSHGRTSKEDRIRALQPFFSDGLIHITTHMDELEREMLSFPRGAHDDILDALSMQVGFWTDEAQDYQKEVSDNLIVNPFSGAAILDELHGRARKLYGYPADIGHLKERALDELPRDDLIYDGVHR